LKHKSTNFPAIYYNILKHEWDLSATVLPWILSFYSLTAFVAVDLPTLTTQVQHYLIATSRYLLGHIFVHLCAFYSIFCVVIHCHLPAFFILFFYVSSVAFVTHFLQRDGQFCVFCLCTAYCSLFLVIGKFDIRCG